jgi:hypothetical protein
MSRVFAVSLIVCAAAAIVPARDALACGGCFVAQSETTQVSGHRMAMSISQDQTTLWDQIEYDGDPAEFAWVLPIAGQVEVGLSSDLLFSALDAQTAVRVSSPVIPCAPPVCPGGGAFSASGSGFNASSSGGGVTVIAEEVVGPYETVQLSSTDPNALNDWLTSHGYNIPADVEPVMAAYVSEGFDFLALRLIPGQGIDAMQPVRITTPGASPILPLRMVAAGTGARTAITLWIIGEGRYEPTNFNVETLSAVDLVWNWDTQSSNYSALRQEILDADGGSRWLMESANPYGSWIFSELLYQAEFGRDFGGYGPDAVQALEAAQADIATLMAGIDENSMWVTRVAADLSRPALGADLSLGASAEQFGVSNNLQAGAAIGTPPPCPPPPTNCPTTVGSGFFENPDDIDGDGDDGGAGSDDGCNCAQVPVRRAGELGVAGLAAAAAILARRLRRRT